MVAGIVLFRNHVLGGRGVCGRGKNGLLHPSVRPQEQRTVRSFQAADREQTQRAV